MHARNTVLATGLAALVSLASLAHGQTFKIAADTFVDSGSPGSPYPATGQPLDGSIVGGQDIYSYGADTKVKAVASSWSSSYPYPTYCHVLFQLPGSFWSALGSGPAQSVVVNYYPFNNSLLAGNDTHTNMELHPLTHAFTVGNGLQNKQPTPPQPSTAGGATWMSYDGAVANAWSTPGGDYDAAHFALYSNTTQPVSNGTVPFSWDITALINDPTTRAELQNFGALIKVNNETDFPPYNPSNGIGGVNDFVSFNSANAADATRQPNVLLVVPEPATLGLGMMAAAIFARPRRRTA